MSKIKVFCRDESKIEEILKYLFENNFSFEILGRQALLVPEGAYKNLSSVDHGWFDVEKIDKFPAQCWQFSQQGPRRSYSLFEKSVPDKFEPVDIPPQKVRSSNPNLASF